MAAGTPSSTKQKPGAPTSQASPHPKSEAQKPEPPKPAVAPVTQTGRRGFLGFMAQMRRGEKPDKSWEGFVAAIADAMIFVGQLNWVDVADMEEELEVRACAALRVPFGVSARYVARWNGTGQSRVVFRTDWGFREAVDGLVGFSLHGSADRLAKAKG